MNFRIMSLSNKKGNIMKKLIQVMMLSLVVLFIGACASNSGSANMDSSQTVKIKNIDKNNVSDTSMEEADQLDPDIIEGNLEDNDFKN